MARRQPKKLPKGTRLLTVGRYDNSSANKGNPNPGRWVYWGDQTWEEMFGGNFGIITDVKVDPKALVREIRR